jgi:hypothetical protein
MPSPNWSALPLASAEVVDRVRDLTASFADYVEVFRLRGPFSGSQLNVHLRALSSRAAFASAAEAVIDSRFADAVRDVLREWGVGSRGTELVPSDVFHGELRKLVPHLAELEQAQIEDRALDMPRIASIVWGLLDSICLVTKHGQPVRNRLVSGSKALHHVLPALVFPIDREYTQTFFNWHNPQFQYNPRGCFEVIFLALAETARAVKPRRFVGEGWMSSPTKILDNAIVGYCVKHGLKSETTRHQQNKRAENKALVNRAKELGIWDAIKAESESRAKKVDR